jgi:hypothetical protein
MKAGGEKISSMVRGLKLGLMVLHTKVTMLTGRNTDEVASPGQIRAHIPETSSRITSKAKAFIIGVTVESTREIGKTTKWRDSEISNGLMVESTKESTSTIKKKEKVLSIGQMEESTRVDGSTESKMALAFIGQTTEPKSKENGRKASVLPG